jgi:hypothetical protein
VRPLMLAALTALSSCFLCSCFFAPDLATSGYAPCGTDGECAAGRFCQEQLCAPPPWNDTAFRERRQLVVKNASTFPLAAGTAVPFRVGDVAAGAVLATADVRVDFRLTRYTSATGFQSVPVYLDREEAAFTVWAPLLQDVAPGAEAAFAIIEQATTSGQLTIDEAPARVFRLFDEVDRQFDPAAVFVRGNVQFDEGEATIPENGLLIWLQPLTAPIDLTFKATVDGINCGQVSMGVTTSDDATTTTPSVQFFFPAATTSPTVVGEVYINDEAGVPLASASPTPVTNRKSQYRIVADENGMRFLINGVVVDEHLNQTRPALQVDKPFFARIDVDGSCAVRLDAIWETPLPTVAPVVTAAPAVTL